MNEHEKHIKVLKALINSIKVYRYDDRGRSQINSISYALESINENEELMKLLSKYRVKEACLKLSKDDKALTEIVEKVFGKDKK